MHARVTSKGQITIPQEIRKAFRLKKGSLVSFVVRGDRAEIIPVQDDVMSLKGSIRVNGPQDFDAIEEEVEKRVAAHVAREA